jgi:tRNA(fMet)-specific endonuclease VapC
VADKILMVDTSLLLDHFRKTRREASRLYQHIEQFDRIAISAVTEYEVLVGATHAQVVFWKDLFSEFEILKFGSRTVEAAVEIKHSLMRKRKSIETADLFIAATAVVHGMTFDTLNTKHFVHIAQLKLLTDSDAG